MTHAYEIKYSKLSKKYKDQYDNIGIILETLEKHASHYFNLEELDRLSPEELESKSPYLTFFDNCIKSSKQEEYTEEEICTTLFPFIHLTINQHGWSLADFTVPKGCTQEIGFVEKFEAKKLGADLTQNTVLNNYAFTPLDMRRTAAASKVAPTVLELSHISFLKDLNLSSSQKPYYIRSDSGDQKGLSQWILLYYKGGCPFLYSESPISEEDKITLNSFFKKSPSIEGGSAALSMSSGMRTVARYIEAAGGAGLSSLGDYFSLLIEWVWFTAGQSPLTFKVPSTFNFSWGYFRQHVLRYSPQPKEMIPFRLLDFYSSAIPDENLQVNDHIQSRSYYLGLDQALADPKLGLLQADPKRNRISLNVPELIDVSQVELAYLPYGAKVRYGFSAPILQSKLKPGVGSCVENMGTAFVINVFRACAKEKILRITLPSKYQLDPTEQALICYLMRNNPFVCEFENVSGNVSLATIKADLKHIFARNRWLSANHYLPPLLAEFWTVAAEYWVAYLKDSPDLFSKEDEVVEFKRCINEMGYHGLVPLLAYLHEKESELKSLFTPLLRRNDKPLAFYAGFQAKEVKPYTQALIKHLKAGNYFPFKQLSISFILGVNDDLIALLDELSQLESFEKISLTDCSASVETFAALESFLQALLVHARSNTNWTSPLDIPELEQPSNHPRFAEIVKLYNELNNLLIYRAREKCAKGLLTIIPFKDASAGQLVDDENEVFEDAQEDAHENITGTPAKISQSSSSVVKKFQDSVQLLTEALSLERSGGISLQMQQQQQIQQERSRALEKEMEQGTAYEDILPSLLVDYQNIDEVLGEHYQKLTQKHLIDTEKATLSGDTELQSFFHTWINANPLVATKHIIQKMTKAAAEMLLKHHRQFSGGLNVHNLPRGFYTQRLSTGQLVLGYKSTLGYTTNHNPLTLQLTYQQPQLERILGNYLQFGPDMTHLRLLAQLQPELPLEERQERFHELSQTKMTKRWADFFKHLENKQWILDNWELVYSAYRSTLPEDLILDLFATKPIQLTSEDMYALLLKDIYKDESKSAQHQRILSLLISQEGKDYSKALGQIYSRYGNYGLERFANLLLTIADHLSPEFLEHFFTNYLAYCDSFTPLLQESSLNAMEEMLKELANDLLEKEFFQQFIELHMQAIEWENWVSLWKGFRYFYNQIKDMDLVTEFKPELLVSIMPAKQNLFPCFERILNSLEKIPNQDLRKAYIKELRGLDLTEGGAPYAVCHEGFILVDPSLELTNFKDGSPSYAPPMTKLYTDQWQPLHALRALASKSHIKPADYKILSQASLSKESLIWALHTKWDSAQNLIDFCSTEEAAFLLDIAAHFYHVFYEEVQLDRCFPLNLFSLLSTRSTDLRAVLAKYPDSTTFFECLSSLPQEQKLQELDRIFSLFTQAPLSHKHLDQGLFLATLFGVSASELEEFYLKNKALKRVTSNELVILIRQLLSLDTTTLPQDLAERKLIWDAILNGIQSMDKHPLTVAESRKELMYHLRDNLNLVFKSSLSGAYRQITDDDLQSLALAQFFEQHADRLRVFLKTHIAISIAPEDERSLIPLIEFFKRLQLNKTYINEVEPLLATLERVLEQYPQKCWTASYFNGLLRALQPQDSAAGFPMGILEALLKEPQSPFAPLAIDEVQPDFDKEGTWGGIFNAILAKDESFTRMQQADLAKLAIRTSEDPNFIMGLVLNLAQKQYHGLRDVILTRLLKNDSEKFEVILKQSEALVALPHEGIVDADWTATCQLWIETLTNHPNLEEQLINFTLSASHNDNQKKVQILHITAWSSFPSHQYPTVPRANYLKGEGRKALKLVERLSTLSEEELTQLHQCYPGRPAPDTRDLLAFIKHKEAQSIDEALGAFLTEKQSAFRQDYQGLSSAREADLLRMLELTHVTRGLENNSLNSEAGFKLMLMFQYLKQLEQGHATVSQDNKPLSKMTQQELQEAFRVCSEASREYPTDERLKTQVWAILFEVLGRTTGKYPHLAQQFALIANDLLLANDHSSILQLKTGEGKSHFVAMRAARHAGLGKKVDVCTAKWSLAERDLLDYQQFFNFLDIKTANIQARSPREIYINADVIYTTPGDLSLFLDEQASQGIPIPVDPTSRVGLGDEFDFLYYEGQKIQFNYARHTGITPKEMAWFYRGLNGFYDQAIKGNRTMTRENLQQCFEFLTTRANEDGLLYLESITPMVLLGWLQSTHEAASLKHGVNYTVRLEQVKIGEEEFPLREIYPLTKDMQAAVGSTFSHGVHQLLAERLNTEAQKKGEAQNHHVHPESHIISSQVFSQRLKTLWGHWEGFTGTVSTSQANELYEEHKTAVLRVPTNQKDLRKWPAPKFFENPQDCLSRMAGDIRSRLHQKKSILFCCATDAEVNEMVEKIKHYFTPEDYNQYFISYTNESHESSADILRRKKDMEGDYLGQKQQGVVLIAAGFGRGDNVDVETVMLGSVHDENDLGQKGGRTARNGEEGEVLQYYLIREINTELARLISALNQSGFKQEILAELTNKEHPLTGYVESPSQKGSLTRCDSNIKFSFLLRLREYIAAKDNYLSLIFHETKASVSSEGINKIGMASVEDKEKLIRGFAFFLNELEKKWMEIRAAHTDNTEESIRLLNAFIQDSCHATNGYLAGLFRGYSEFKFSPSLPKESQFILDNPVVQSEDVLLRSAAQGLLLKLSDLPEDANSWDELVADIIELEEESLPKFRLLLEVYQAAPQILFNELNGKINAIKGEHLITEQTTAYVEHLKLENITEFFVKTSLSVQHQKQIRLALATLPSRASNLALDYLLSPEHNNYPQHVDRIFNMLMYSAKNNEVSLSYWENPIVRDDLLSLPVDCFDEKVYLNAGVLVGIKKFLDRFVDSGKQEKEYVELFKQFVRSMEYQPEHRKRLFSQYEIIINRSNNAPVDVLKQLAQLSEYFKAPENLNILKNLTEKMKKEYEQPRVTVAELDSLLDNLLKLGPNLLSILPVLESHIALEGKEFITRLNIISRLDPEIMIDLRLFLKDYFPKNPLLKKTEKIAEYEETLGLLKEVFKKETSSPYQLGKIFNTFNNYLISDVFESFPDKKALFDGIHQIALRKIGAKDLFPLFENTQKMGTFVYLSHLYPEHIETLLACEPLVAMISQIENKETKESTIASIKHLMENIKQYNTPLKSVKERLLTFTPKELWRLLDICSEQSGNEVEILFNSLVSVTAENLTPQEYHVIFDFYKHLTEKPLWIQKNLMGMPVNDRLYLMNLLKQGAFILQDQSAGCPVFSEIDNNKLFQCGLNAYQAQVQQILRSSQSISHSRGLSRAQQGSLLQVMSELNTIGKAPMLQEITGSVKKELMINMKDSITLYEKIKLKDHKRYIAMAAKIHDLENATGKSYAEMMKGIRDIKMELMRNDVEKASKQRLPRLHFFGQSRLYRTMNNIEDMVLKAWVAEAHQKVETSEHFVESYRETRDSYVDQLKTSLHEWNTNRDAKGYGLFKNKAVSLASQLQSLTHEGVVDYLKAHKKEIDSLPGTLKAIVKEVLAHDAEIPSSQLKPGE